MRDMCALAAAHHAGTVGVLAGGVYVHTGVLVNLWPDPDIAVDPAWKAEFDRMVKPFVNFGTVGRPGQVRRAARATTSTLSVTVPRLPRDGCDECNGRDDGRSYWIVNKPKLLALRPTTGSTARPSPSK